MPANTIRPKSLTFLLGRNAKVPSGLSSPRVITSVKGLRSSISEASKDSLWISYDSRLTDELLKSDTGALRSLGLGVFVHELDSKAIPALTARFRKIAYSCDGFFIDAEELEEVFDSENPENLMIGGFVNQSTQTVTLWRGNLEPLIVPFSAFEISGAGTAPDFQDLSIIDCGQTLKLGEYEAAVDAILYEFDAKYRRTISRKRRLEDRSFGAALRRLRLQKGLRREDFSPDLAAKTVARIEQGEVKKIRKSTLESLARRLNVEPGQIKYY